MIGDSLCPSSFPATVVKTAVEKALSMLLIDSVMNYPLLAGIGASLLDFRRAATNRYCKVKLLASRWKCYRQTCQIRLICLTAGRGASVLEQWACWIKNAGEHTVEELRELLPGLEFLRATVELNAI